MISWVKYGFSLSLLIGGTIAAPAQSVQQVRATARNDLKDSIERLTLLREQVEKEKIPLQSGGQARTDARDKRAEIDRLRQRDGRTPACPTQGRGAGKRSRAGTSFAY